MCLAFFIGFICGNVAGQFSKILKSCLTLEDGDQNPVKPNSNALNSQHPMANVQLHLTEKNGYFFIEDQGMIQAQMTFIFAGPERIIIDHTEVQPGNEGKGYGKQMVSAAVDYAREKHIKILPLCPFAKSVFDRTPEFRDVL